MKNIILVPGKNGPSGTPWMEDIRRTFINRCPVFVAEFEDKEKPDYFAWEGEMDKLRKQITPESLVISHSLGVPFSIKYLARRNLPVNTFVSVGGYDQTSDLGYNRTPMPTSVPQAIRERYNHNPLLAKMSLHYTQLFMPTTHDYIHLIQKVPNRIGAYSNNDHLFPEKDLRAFINKIRAQQVFVPNLGHMSSKTNVTFVPEINNILENFLEPKKTK